MTMHKRWTNQLASVIDIATALYRITPTSVDYKLKVM